MIYRLRAFPCLFKMSINVEDKEKSATAAACSSSDDFICNDFQECEILAQTQIDDLMAYWFICNSFGLKIASSCAPERASSERPEIVSPKHVSLVEF